jgi:hypothetical protein
LPIFNTRSQIGIKVFASKLKEITDEKGIITSPKEQMPQDKRRKETKHIAKRRF